jgi:hypothetical protein
MDPAAAQAAVEERQRGGLYQSLADFRRRVSLAPQDLALMVRAGCFDFAGRSRQAHLREAEARQLGRLPPWWEGRDEYGNCPARATFAPRANAGPRPLPHRRGPKPHTGSARQPTC